MLHTRKAMKKFRFIEATHFWAEKFNFRTLASGVHLRNICNENFVTSPIGYRDFFMIPLIMKKTCLDIFMCADFRGKNI